MDIAHAIPTTVKSISFSFLTSDDVRRISVKQIVNPTLLDDFNQPTNGGLYDPALGPVQKSDMWKAVYEAKLRLLSHGLAEAAMGVDDIALQETRRAETGKSPSKFSVVVNPDEDMLRGGDDSEAEGFVQQSAASLGGRLDAYVKKHLKAASGSKRDDYHDGVAYHTIKALKKSFMGEIQGKTCYFCGAAAYRLKKEGHTKIIEFDLLAKQKEKNLLLGVERPLVLAGQTYDHRNVGRKETAGKEDNTDDEDNSDGESIEHSDSDGSVAPSSSKAKVKTEEDEKAPAKSSRERVIVPEELREHIRLLFVCESTLCGLIWGRHGPLSSASAHDSDIGRTSADMFFMQVVPVPPTRFRPPATMNDQIMEHPQNSLLTKVLQTSYRLRELSRELKDLTGKGTVMQRDDTFNDGGRVLGSLLFYLIQLQIDVNSFMESKKNPTILRQGQLPIPGVKDLLEKKEGLFRKNMMGKRVNFAARSVISPDVNIESNEIGIPPVFARKLTFPEPVTQHNVHVMRQLVINGPWIYPGASAVQMEDGTLQTLDRMTAEQRTALANQLMTPQEGSRANLTSHTLRTRTMGRNKKVLRHLRDGDHLILNRQPTLHKPSMMVHRARVLRGEKTIRMHYANCNSYNADFDGDEMNIHFPQSEVARAEARFIANNDNQYLVPTSGNPLRGLIQDHVVAGVWMTNKAIFFTREEYHQIIYGALRPEDNYSGGGHVLTVPPAIWKPRPLWTGKQLISTIMLNITPETAAGMHLLSNSKILNTHWGNFDYTKEVDFQDGSKMFMKLDGEETVIFYDGDLLCGILDKSQFGASAYGMVHSVYELYGAEVAGRLLSILSRLFTKFLQHRAFTCRMDDLLLTPEADRIRTEQLIDARNWGHEAATANFPALEGLPSDQRDRQLKILLEEVSRDDKRMNGLDVTVKKKMAKLTQSIASSSIPNGLHRRFPENHMQTMVMSGAKGSAVNARQISCGLGQTELEGRRVPLMVSGKSLPSFRALETAAIAGGYIGSRFLTGIKPQEFYFHCMAGREGLIDTAVKTSRSGYLQRCLIKHLEGLRIHYDNTVRGSDNAVYQFLYGGDGLDVTKQMHLTQFDWTARNAVSLVSKANIKALSGNVNDQDAIRHMKKILKHSDQPNRYSPTLAKYSPVTYLGSTSEIFARSVDDYIKKAEGNTIKRKNADTFDNKKPPDMMHSSRFRDLMNVRYMRALVEPGEAIGLLAAQGIGEPSTQMTLNTFHFAGHGAANVTLGIPRLREIVMTASEHPQTPTMTLPIKGGTTREAIDTFCKKANRLTLSEVIDDVQVTERLVIVGAVRKRQFTVQLNLFPPAHYEKEYRVTKEELLVTFGRAFPMRLKAEIAKELKKMGIATKMQAGRIGKGRKQAKEDRAIGVAADGDEAEPDAPEGYNNSEMSDVDIEDEKATKRKTEQVSYDDDESDGESDGKESDVPVMTDKDLEASFDSDNLDGDEKMLARAAKKQAQPKWKELLFEARHTFDDQGNPYIMSLDFNKTGQTVNFKVEFEAKTPKVLLVGIIERSCVKTIVREIPGITRCREFIPENKNEGPKFMTEGSNIRGLWAFENGEGDLDSIESNDVAAVLKTYGVELARHTIIQEMSNVFGVYNIKVDKRHLTIIADYMTFDGGYKPFNRTGIAKSSSVLLKASFETTGAFLSEATLAGDFDDLSSPASSIVMGQPPRSGTGMFGIQAPLKLD
ncbi:hypothetical protein FRB96_005744 [Tulasnella sp. 330]|nr:hypothetical protein FRB96_005744 [Tulasnella sp. 330]KAG8886574.1 hypothetical protein FRB98_001222 [Tulasnella sp. 332]